MIFASPLPPSLFPAWDSLSFASSSHRPESEYSKCFKYLKYFITDPARPAHLLGPGDERVEFALKCPTQFTLEGSSRSQTWASAKFEFLRSSIWRNSICFQFAQLCLLLSNASVYFRQRNIGPTFRPRPLRKGLAAGPLRPRSRFDSWSTFRHN